MWFRITFRTGKVSYGSKGNYLIMAYASSVVFMLKLGVTLVVGRMMTFVGGTFLILSTVLFYYRVHLA